MDTRTPSQPKADTGRPSTSRTTSRTPRRERFSILGLVERPPAIDDLVVHPNHNVECHTGLDAIFLANYLCESLVEMLGLGLCQKSDPSEVDAQYRNGRFLSEFGGAQKCAVTTENQN